MVGVFRVTALSTAAAICLVKVSLQPITIGLPATIVFAPWVSNAEAIARATVGADVLSISGAPFVVTVIPKRADYETLVAESGAWVVTGLSGWSGCALRNKILRAGS